MKSKIDKQNSKLRLIVRDERTGKIDFAASELTLNLVDKASRKGDSSDVKRRCTKNRG